MIIGVRAGCCLKTKLSQGLSQCDGSDWLLRAEPWLCSVTGPREMEEASFCGRCCAVSYCLTWDLTHLVPHGTQQQKEWPLYKNTGASLSCSIGSSFVFIFCVWYILRRIPVVPSWCPLRLTAHHRLLSAGSLDTVRLEEPVSSACSSLFHPAVSSPALWWSCPDQLVELGSCRLPWTPIKYWCLAFCAGWLTKDELYETEREKHSGEDGGSKEVCIKIKELIAVSCAKISYMHI